MKKKDVMAATGCSEKMLRYYEDHALIHPHTSRSNGRTSHDYSESDIQDLQDVMALRQAMFTVDEIRRIQERPASIPETVAAYHTRISGFQKELEPLLALNATEAGSWKELSSQVRDLTVSPAYSPTPHFRQFDPEPEADEIGRPSRWRKCLVIALPVTCFLVLLFITLGLASANRRQGLEDFCTVSAQAGALLDGYTDATPAALQEQLSEFGDGACLAVYSQDGSRLYDSVPCFRLTLNEQRYLAVLGDTESLELSWTLDALSSDTLLDQSGTASILIAGQAEDGWFYPTHIADKTVAYNSDSGLFEEWNWLLSGNNADDAEEAVISGVSYGADADVREARDQLLKEYGATPGFSIRGGLLKTTLFSTASVLVGGEPCLLVYYNQLTPLSAAFSDYGIFFLLIFFVSLICAALLGRSAADARKARQRVAQAASTSKDIDFAIYNSVATGQVSSKGTRAQEVGIDMNNNQKLATLNLLRHLDDD